MSLKGSLAGLCLLVALFAPAPAAVAQEEEPPEGAPAAKPEEQPGEKKEEGKKLPLGLYVELASGMAEADDIDPSIATLSTHVTRSLLSLDENTYAHAAIGWKLPHEKGDFRLAFNGYSEDRYKFSSIGDQSAIAVAVAGPGVRAPLLWWTLDIDDGVLHSVRTPPVWIESMDDANMNGFVDPGEQRYTGPDLEITREVPDNLQNRLQSFDVSYGREWGPRRFRGRWWGGMRYFTYEGTIPATAWLNIVRPGEGFTDGAFRRLILFRQEASGIGPTGSLEAQFKFFRERFSLFLGGQIGFVVSSLEADSGQFYTLATNSSGQNENVPAPARLTRTRNKSTWQTHAEAGMRYAFRGGLQLEVAWAISGYLDTVTLPTQIRIPENTQETGQGTSGVWNTQDYVVQGWRAGIAFQF